MKDSKLKALLGLGVVSVAGSVGTLVEGANEEIAYQNRYNFYMNVWEHNQMIHRFPKQDMVNYINQHFGYLAQSASDLFVAGSLLAVAGIASLAMYVRTNHKNKQENPGYKTKE